MKDTGKPLPIARVKHESDVESVLQTVLMSMRMWRCPPNLPAMLSQIRRDPAAVKRYHAARKEMKRLYDASDDPHFIPHFDDRWGQYYVALDEEPSTSNSLVLSGADSWDQVALRFLEYDRVAVSIRGQRVKIADFSELGFMDRRTKKPNEAWKLLKAVAADDGLFRTKAGELLAARTKILARLQVQLKAIFGIADQPFKPYSRSDRGRRARFTATPEPFARD
ncbi:MAG TPA: hypothetical protein VI078_16940 [bacterium]